MLEPSTAIEVQHGSMEAVLVVKTDEVKGVNKAGMHVCFKHLTYTTNAPSKTKLLENVSGFLQPANLTAVLGPSGAGKTTLLDVLAGRATAGVRSGEVTYGGAAGSPAFLQRYTGYVEQFDTLIGTLTVKEMLMYTAEMKRPLQEPHSSKQFVVASLIDNLGLDSCANVPIRNGLSKGISGGECKRVNIGIALVSEPRVLYLDEPTSGLDSASSFDIMKLVKGVASQGTTVCATIHSPSRDVFALFDQLIILARSHVVYFGPQGSAAIDYAKQLWHVGDHFKAEHYAAEFLIDAMTEADKSGDGRMLADIYAKSELKQHNDAKLEQLMCDLLSGMHTNEQLAKALAVSSSTSTPSWWALWILIKYRTRVNYKNPAWVVPRIADKVIFAFIIITLYLRIADKYETDNIINMAASLFMWTALPSYGAMAYVPSIVLERALFYRERADGLYSVVAYYVAKLLEELILAALVSVALSLSVFYGVNYQGSFGLFWLVYLLTLTNGLVLGYLVAALAPNMDVANAALPAYCTTMLFFAGQLATISSMPSYWKWFSYLDLLRYSWGALMVNQFEHNDLVFTADGTTVLEYYSLKHASKWEYVSLMLAFFGVFASLGYLALSFVKHSKR